MADYAKDSEKQAALRRQIRPRRTDRQRHDKHERDGDRQSFLLHFLRYRFCGLVRYFL